MANWASTSYAVEGPKEVLEKIEQAILHPDVQEGSDELWEGNVLRALGIKWNERKYDGTCTGDYLRGFLDGGEPYWLGDNVLRFDAEEAWGATDFHEVLDRNLPVKTYYVVEESGEGVYATNDREGKYFPDRYYADVCIDGNYQSEYFAEEDSVYAWLSKITSGKISTEEDVWRFNDEHESLVDYDYISIYEFDIID